MVSSALHDTRMLETRKRREAEHGGHSLITSSDVPYDRRCRCKILAVGGHRGRTVRVDGK